jgi:hypothetical protein
MAKSASYGETPVTALSYYRIVSDRILQCDIWWDIPYSL